MSELLLGMMTALWLGILTSISPCPLATNIAAISYIGRRVGSPPYVFWTGVVYTAGRTLTYLCLAVLLVSSLLSIPSLSFWLQKYMNQMLGPVLILAGMFLLELLSFRGGNWPFLETLQKRAETKGLWGAGLLGMLFAFSFCPVSAALFFGSLIPLAIRQQSQILLPSLYGIGTALPVFIFSLVLAFGFHKLSAAYQKAAQIELWARRITGTLFIAVGMEMSLSHIFGWSIW